MPNGGSDNCGECGFFSWNLYKVAPEEDEELRLPHCILRRITINKKSPFWTYCENYQPDLSQEKTDPSGHVYVDAGQYPYNRKIWITEEQQAHFSRGQKALADFARKNLNLVDPQLGDEYSYSSLPLCIIDSVFSIGAHYNSTKRVIERFQAKFCQGFGPTGDGSGNRSDGGRPTVRDLIKIYEEYGVGRMASDVYQNRQRTSTKSGILKAEAVLEFSRVLMNFDVNSLKDVEKIIANPEFEEEIKEIPGQKSGVSLVYFYILVGAKDYVKPDRMIKRFLENLLGRKVAADECHQLIFGASLILAKEFPYMRACYLDHLMWKYQSGRQPAART